MSWLEDRLARLAPFRRGGAAVAGPEEMAADSAVSEKAHPPLMLLVNDASGRASFKTHVFDSAESATDFILYWFPNRSEGGIIAFWAMTQAPQFGLDSPSETAAEALVMIRDVKRDEVVYLFSFVDMHSAQEFLREEAHHGTDLRLMMLYWAVPVRLTTDPWGRMMLMPSSPPGTAPDFEIETPVSDTWSPPQALPVLESDRSDPAEEPRDVFEEAPNAHTGVADPMGGIDETFELTSWMDRPRKKSHKRLYAGPETNHGEPAEEPRDVFEEAPNAHTGVADPLGGIDETFELTSWMDRPRKKSHKRLDAEPEKTSAFERPTPERRSAEEREVRPAPEASESVFEPASAPPEIVAREEYNEAPVEAEVVETVVEPAQAQTELVAADEQAEAPEAEEVETTVEPAPAAVELVAADERAETPAELEAALEESVDSPPEVAPAIENAAGESVPEPAPELAPAEVDVTPDALEPDVLREKMRARTNGNGHKKLPANGNNALTSNHIVAEVHVNGDANGITFPVREEAPPAEEQRAEITFGAQVPETAFEPEQAGNGHVDETIEIRIDIQLLSSRALKVKRWEVKEEPFEGFNSPPGRF